MAKVTIEDISQETGLSRGTVSRAINNRPDISEATRARVLEACRKLNYRPSHAARSLATGRSYTVTFLYHQMDAFSAQALRGVLAAAAEARYFVHLVSLDQQPAERIAALPSERLDGFIASCPLSREAVSQLAEVHPLRTVVSTTVEGPAGVDVFRPDLREAGRLQARYALS
ncbi:MAG: LacI family DNA-binding transcriptional regulator, partial [Phycisphaerales bacterium]|nr:LacI family DNA-binding transcriptional regulator [Phycisphaerales bacterium]